MRMFVHAFFCSPFFVPHVDYGLCVSSRKKKGGVGGENRLWSFGAELLCAGNSKWPMQNGGYVQSAKVDEISLPKKCGTPRLGKSIKLYLKNTRTNEMSTTMFFHKMVARAAQLLKSVFDDRVFF